LVKNKHFLKPFKNHFFSSDTLFSEYDEVNQAAEKLLIDYTATSSTIKTPRLPFGRDEKKIYPFATSSPSTTTNSYDNNNNNEYDYATNDEYDEDEDEIDKKSTSTPTTTSTEADLVNYDQVEAGDSDWDTTNDDTESTFDIKIDEQNQQAFINEVKQKKNFFLIFFLLFRMIFVH
jgi:hypothetical protein